MTGTWRPFVVLAVLIETSMVALRSLGDLRFKIPETTGILLMTSIFYLIAVFLSLQPGKIGGQESRWLPLFLMTAALVFRFTVWPMQPQLSDDPFRYRWEGLIQAYGGNPYQSQPDAAEWRRLRDATYPRISGPDVKSGYGPFVELVERAMYQVVAPRIADPFRQAFWFKLPAALFDAGVIALLWVLLAMRNLPRERILIYAWSPAPLMEFWATGHNDAIMLFFLVAALLLAAKEWWMPAFGALTLSAGAKIWPAALFPIWIGWRAWRPVRWYQWLVSLPIAALLAAPYWSDVEQNARFLSGFLGGWRNNDSIYGLLLWILGDQYPAKYAAFTILGVTIVAVSLLRWPLERAVLTVIAVMLMISANCHPWYLTWMIPLLVFVPVPALLLWTVLGCLSYRVVIDWALLAEWHGSTPLRWLVYVPVYALLAGTAVVRRVRRVSIVS